jgi:hypothetical protein
VSDDHDDLFGAPPPLPPPPTSRLVEEVRHRPGRAYKDKPKRDPWGYLDYGARMVDGLATFFCSVCEAKDANYRMAGVWFCHEHLPAEFWRHRDESARQRALAATPRRTPPSDSR